MELLSVQSLLQQGLFKIPNYQRGYAWGSAQLDDFIDDLTSAINLKEHYTGAITVVEVGERSIFPKSFKVYDVVDGQQRLTTFTIFIQCIYARLKALDIQSDILNDIQKNIIYRDNPILELNDDSKDFYLNKILNLEVNGLLNDFSNKSEANLAEAKKHITKFLHNKKKQSDIEAIYNCLMTKFKVNFYKLSSESEVGVVFETMNNRGLPLNQMDKVKNYLIFLSSRIQNDELASKINESFGFIFKQLIRIPESSFKIEDEFLRYAYIVYTGNFKEFDIHKQIKDTLIPKNKFSEKTITEFTDFLKDTSEIFANIHSDNFYKDSRINAPLKKLKAIGNMANFIPLLIALLYKNPNPDDLAEIVYLLEKFSFRVYSVIKSRSDKGQKHFHQLAFTIFTKNKISLDKIKSEIKGLINEVGSDNKFKESLNDQNLYLELRSSKTLLYLFEEYEEHLIRTKKSQIDLFNENKNKSKSLKKKISVEHILSQTAQNNSKSKYINKLGNLVITKNNSALSNKTFPSKKEYYKKSDLLSEHEISEYSEWNDKTIKERTDKLIKFALERWKK